MIPIVKTPDYDPKLDDVWSYLSTFFNFFSQKKEFETMWDGVQKIYSEILRRVYNANLAQSPNTAYTDGAFDYIQLDFSMSNALPIYLNPTDEKTGFLCTPILSEKLQTTQDENFNNIQRIKIFSSDIANYGNGVSASDIVYVVIRKFDGSIKYGRLESIFTDPETTAATGGTNISVSGISYDDVSDSKFNFYLTTAKSFRVDSLLRKIDQLVSCINIPSAGLVFNIGENYSFENSIIKFNMDILGSYGPDFTLYIPNGEITLDDIYNNFGGLVGINNWSDYKWSNEDARGCFMAIVRGYYLAGNPEITRSALCALHGISVVNRDSTVLGLFESYEYNVTQTEALGGESFIYLSENLNPLFFADSKYIPRVCVITKDDMLLNILGYDEATKKIKVNTISNVSVGDKLCIELINSFRFNSIKPNADTPKYEITLNDPLSPAGTSVPPFLKYLMEYVDQAGIYNLMPGEENNPLSRPHQLPRMMIDSSRFSGVFHMYGAPTDGVGITSLITMAPAASDYTGAEANYPYNDIIEPPLDGLGVVDPYSTISIQGKARIYWPTHKFLLLEGKTPISAYAEPVGSNLIIKKQKLYIESTMETYLSKDDTVKALSCAVENVDVLTSITFPNWTEFAGFRKSPNIDLQTGFVNAYKYAGEYDFGSYIQRRFTIDIEAIYPVYGKNDRLTIKIPSSMTAAQRQLWFKSDLSFISFNYIYGGAGKKFSAHIISFEKSPVNDNPDYYTVYIDRNIPEGVFYEVAAVEGESGRVGIEYTYGSLFAKVLGGLSESNIAAGDTIVIHNPSFSDGGMGVMTSRVFLTTIDSIATVGDYIELTLHDIPDLIDGPVQILNTTHTNVYSALGAIPFMAIYYSNQDKIEKPGFTFELSDNMKMSDTGEYLNDKKVQKVTSLFFRLNSTYESGILEYIKNNPGVFLWLYHSGNLVAKINPLEIQIVELASKKLPTNTTDEICVRITGEFRMLTECFGENRFSGAISGPLDPGDSLKASLIYTNNFNFSGINNIIRGMHFSEDSITSEADVVFSKKTLYSSLIGDYNKDTRNISTKNFNNYLESDFQFICDFLHKHNGNYSTNKHQAFLIFSGNIMSEIIDTDNKGLYPITPEQLMQNNSSPYLQALTNTLSRIVYPKQKYELSDYQYDIIANEFTGYDWVGLSVMSGALLQSEDAGDFDSDIVSIKHRFGFKPVFECIFCDVGVKDEAENGDGDGSTRIGRMNVFEPDSVSVTSGQCTLAFGAGDSSDPGFGSHAFRDIFFYIPNEETLYKEYITSPSMPNFMYPLNFTEFLRRPDNGNEEFYDNTMMGGVRMLATTDLYPFRSYSPLLEEIISDAIYFKKSPFITDMGTAYLKPRFLPVWNYDFRQQGITSSVYLNRGYMKNRYIDSSIFIYHSRLRNNMQMIDFFDEISHFDPRRVDMEPWVIWDPVHEWCARYVDVNDSVNYESLENNIVKNDSITGYHDPLNRHECPPEIRRPGTVSNIGDERHLIYCLYKLKFSETLGGDIVPTTGNVFGPDALTGKLLAVRFAFNHFLDDPRGKIYTIPSATPATEIDSLTRMYNYGGTDIDSLANVCMDDLVIDLDGDSYDKVTYWRVKKIDRERNQLFIEACLPLIMPTVNNFTAPNLDRLCIVGSESRVIKTDISELDVLTKSANGQGYVLGRVVSISDGYVYLWSNGSGKQLLDTMEYIANSTNTLLELEFFTIDNSSLEDNVRLNSDQDVYLSNLAGSDIYTTIPSADYDEINKSIATIINDNGLRFIGVDIEPHTCGTHVSGKHVFINNKTYRISESYFNEYGGDANRGRTMLLNRKNVEDGGEIQIGLGDDNSHLIKLKGSSITVPMPSPFPTLSLNFDTASIKNLKILSLDTAGIEYAGKAFYHLTANGFSVHDCGKYLISKAKLNQSDVNDYIGLGSTGFDDTIKRIVNSIGHDYGDVFDNPDDIDNRADVQLAPHIVYNGTDNKGVFIGKTEEDLYCHLNVGMLEVKAKTADKIQVQMKSFYSASSRASRLQITNCSIFNDAWVSNGRIFIGGTSLYPNLDDRQFVVDEKTAADTAWLIPDNRLPMPISLLPEASVDELVWDRLSCTFGAKCYLGIWPTATAHHIIGVKLNKQYIATLSTGEPLMVIKVMGYHNGQPAIYFIMKNDTDWLIVDAEIIILASGEANPMAWMKANSTITGITGFTIDITVDTEDGYLNLDLLNADPNYFSGQTQLFAYFDYYEKTAICKTPIAKVAIFENAIPRSVAMNQSIFEGDFIITTKFSMSSAYRNYLAQKCSSIDVSVEELPAEDNVTAAGVFSWYNMKSLLSLVGGMSDYCYGQGEIYEKFRLERIVGYQPVNSRMIPGIIQVDYLGRNITSPADITVIGDFDRNIAFGRYAALNSRTYDTGLYDAKQFGFHDDDRVDYAFSKILTSPSSNPNSSDPNYNIHDMFRKIDFENASYVPSLPCRYLVEYISGEPAKVIMSVGLAYWSYDRGKPQPYSGYETPMYLFKLNLSSLKFDYNSLFSASDAVPQSKSFMDFYVRGAGTKFINNDGSWADNTGLVMYIWDFLDKKWYSYYGYDASGKAVPRNTNDPTYLINNVLVN